MPLFFVLSGAAIYYSFKSRSASVFLKERFKRIFIPLAIVGYFVTSPPQMYFERLTHHRFEGAFWEFIPAYFQGVDMFGGNFPWHGPANRGEERNRLLNQGPQDTKKYLQFHGNVR